MGRKISSKWNSTANITPKNFTVQLQSRMMRLADQICEAAIRDVAEQVLEKALEYTPMEEGDLRGTGRVEYVEKRNGRWEANIAFGDSEINYAFFVEMDIPQGVAKNYTTPGTGAFYLTRAGDEIATMETFRTALQEAARNTGA